MYCILVTGIPAAGKSVMAKALAGIKKRGFDDFSVGGKKFSIDTTDFAGLDMEKIFLQITLWIRNLQADEDPDV